MSWNEETESTEANNDDEFIVVWPCVDSDQGKSVRVDRDHGPVSIARSQVSWVEVRGRFLEFYLVSGERYALRGTLTSWERRWAEHGFVRIHASYLVSLAHVRELCRTSEGGRKVCLLFGGGDRYRPISRRRYSQFKRAWISHIEVQYKNSFVDLD
jgi:two-component system, LytTR family, response regulator LytT